MSVPRFWREIPVRYNLEASKCTVCNEMHFPPREICPTCRRASIGKLERRNMSSFGEIVEWTTVHKAAPGYEQQVPYVVALIRSTDGPTLTGQIVDSNVADLHHGARVKAVFRKVGQDGESGVIHYGTKWMVAPSEESTDLQE